MFKLMSTHEMNTHISSVIKASFFFFFFLHLVGCKLVVIKLPV